MIADHADQFNKKARTQERKLLLYCAIYAFVGVIVLYLGGNTKEFSVLLILSAVFGGMAAFAALSILWSLTGFKADPYLLPITALLTSTGLIFLLRLNSDIAARQFIWLMTALAALAITTTLLRHYRALADYKYVYALLGTAALLLPIFWGVEQGGSRSWLDFGLFQVQTSEFVKILLVLFLAAFLVENRRVLSTGTATFLGLPVPTVSEWGPLVFMWGIAMVLLVFQRDLGTALIYFATFLAMLYTATSRFLYVLFGTAVFSVSGFLSYRFFNHVQSRVDIWLNPWPYFETSGYQVIQSLFAIAEGGLIGVGLGAGRPDLIPAVHTDFIFSAVCEEMGLLGGGGIIILFILFIYRGLKIALSAEDDFSALFAAGLTSLMALQVFIITAGVIKLLPLTGVTLPYISYGGSSLVVNYILLGFLLNISHEAGCRHE